MLSQIFWLKIKKQKKILPQLKFDKTIGEIGFWRGIINNFFHIFIIDSAGFFRAIWATFEPYLINSSEWSKMLATIAIISSPIFFITVSSGGFLLEGIAFSLILIASSIALYRWYKFTKEEKRERKPYLVTEVALPLLLGGTALTCSLILLLGFCGVITAPWASPAAILTISGVLFGWAILPVLKMILSVDNRRQWRLAKKNKQLNLFVFQKIGYLKSIITLSTGLLLLAAGSIALLSIISPAFASLSILPVALIAIPLLIVFLNIVAAFILTPAQKLGLLNEPDMHKNTTQTVFVKENQKEQQDQYKIQQYEKDNNKDRECHSAVSSVTFLALKDLQPNTSKVELDFSNNPLKDILNPNRENPRFEKYYENDTKQQIISGFKFFNNDNQPVIVKFDSTCGNNSWRFFRQGTSFEKGKGHSIIIKTNAMHQELPQIATNG